MTSIFVTAVDEEFERSLAKGCRVHQFGLKAVGGERLWRITCESFPCTLGYVLVEDIFVNLFVMDTDQNIVYGKSWRLDHPRATETSIRNALRAIAERAALLSHLNAEGRLKVEIAQAVVQRQSSWKYCSCRFEISAEELFIVLIVECPRISAAIQGKLVITFRPEGHGTWVVHDCKTRTPTEARWLPKHFVPESNFEVCVLWALSRIDAHVHALMLPIDVARWGADLRQVLLVAKPLQIVEQATKCGNAAVAWAREITLAAISMLEAKPVDATVLVRKLFFQLLAVEFAVPSKRDAEFQRYRELGLELAAARRVNPSLPYNPMFPYTRFKVDGTDPCAKIVPADRLRLDWFLNKSTLEQIVQAMEIL